MSGKENDNVNTGREELEVWRRRTKQSIEQAHLALGTLLEKVTHNANTVEEKDFNAARPPVIDIPASRGNVLEKVMDNLTPRPATPLAPLPHPIESQYAKNKTAESWDTSMNLSDLSLVASSPRENSKGMRKGILEMIAASEKSLDRCLGNLKTLENAWTLHSPSLPGSLASSPERSVRSRASKSRGSTATQKSGKKAAWKPAGHTSLGKKGSRVGGVKNHHFYLYDPQNRKRS